jgi:hypothetical protein
MSAILRFAPWLALLGLSWFGGCQMAKNEQQDAEIKRLYKQADRLMDQANQRDTVYRTDTVRLTRTRLVTDSVLLVDTLIHRDTVRVLVERERLACDAALETCEARVAYRDSIIANLDSVTKAQQRRGGNWKTKLGWLLAGAAAGVLIPR